jgi:LacI family transcriptional regulator
MANRPKQADVARLAGVSRATVSFVLNERFDTRVPISEETRKRVQEAARQLGYEPNVLARSLKSGASLTIGTLLPALHNPHYWEILEGAEEEITARGYYMALVVSNLNPDRELQALRSLFQQRLDGMILLPTFMDLFPDELHALKQQSIPVVFTNPMEGMDWVFPDIGGGAEQLMDHLLSLGHKRIGFISGVARPNLSQARLEVYRQKMAAAGTPTKEEWIRCCGYHLEDGYLEAKALLDLPESPSAIWAINDLLAIGALRAAHERGLRVPQDVAVAGFDDIAVSAQLSPPLTTVRMYSQEIGRRAAQILFTRLDEPDHALMQELVKTQLIVRQSTNEEI